LVQQSALQELFLQHAQLIGGHFASIRAKLLVELAPRLKQLFIALARAGEGDHLIFERRQALLQLFQILIVGFSRFQQELQRRCHLFKAWLQSHAFRCDCKVILQLLE